MPHIIDQISVANKFMTVLRHYDLDYRKYRVISGSCEIVGAKILIILEENMHFKLLYLIYTSNILF